MFPLLRQLWVYRKEIAFTLALIETLRKTARDVTKQYLKRKVQKELTRQILIVGFQILCLGFAIFIVRQKPSLFNQQIGSLILWAVTLYNAYQLLFYTLPEIWAVRKILKSKIGYHLQYVLQISLVNELLHANLILLICCLLLALLSRTLLGIHLSYSALLY